MLLLTKHNEVVKHFAVDLYGEVVNDFVGWEVGRMVKPFDVGNIFGGQIFCIDVSEKTNDGMVFCLFDKMKAASDTGVIIHGVSPFRG